MTGVSRGRLVVPLVAALALGILVAVAGGAAGPADAPGASPSDVPARGGVPEPKIRFDPIPFDRGRKRQMANYSNRHYGKRDWRLENPRAVVLHYTAGSSYESAFNTFASNTPSLGESPGVCAQFVVDKDGTIYQLTRLYVRCRHTIGLNHLSIGIEMVQEQLGSSHATSAAILARKAQARAAIRLTAWLRQRYGIDSRNVLGHAMANDSPLFKDLQGWRNDHTDWPKAEVKIFRRRVIRVIRSHRRPATARQASASVSHVSAG